MIYKWSSSKPEPAIRYYQVMLLRQVNSQPSQCITTYERLGLGEMPEDSLEALQLEWRSILLE